jgi:hypothetical protein
LDLSWGGGVSENCREPALADCILISLFLAQSGNQTSPT